MLDARSRLGHDNGRGNLKLASRESDTLSVVTGGTAHNTLPALSRVEMGQLVVRAAQFEAEDGLFVCTLEKDMALESIAQVDGVG